MSGRPLGRGRRTASCARERHAHESVRAVRHDRPVKDWQIGLIAAGSALLGSLGGTAITAWFSLRVNNRQLAAGAQAELLACLSAYGYALDRLELEMQQLPPGQGRLVRATQRALLRVPQLDWSIGQVGRHTLARPAMRAIDTYSAAANRLLLVAPEELLPSIERLNDLLTDVASRDADWKQRWRAARSEHALAARRSVGR